MRDGRTDGRKYLKKGRTDGRTDENIQIRDTDGRMDGNFLTCKRTNVRK